MQLTWLPGTFLPDGMMRDGRVLFEAVFPGTASMARELYTVYTDGSGVESHRCDHGPDRRSAAELASGDLVFQSGAAGRDSLRLAPDRSNCSCRRESMPDRWPRRKPGMARRISREPRCTLLDLPLSAAAGRTASQGSRTERLSARARPRPSCASLSSVEPGQPGRRQSAVPECLYSKSQQIPANSVAEVRVWSRNTQGSAILLGNASVEPDGSFYVQVPSEEPLRFELLGRDGATIAAEKSWFWARKGEQRVCVGCHAGPERAPENAVPQVLLRTQKPVSMLKPVD